MRTALIVGLLTLLALDVCQSKAGGEKQGDGSRTVDADTKKLFDQRDHPLRSYSEDMRPRLACSTGPCGTANGSCRDSCMSGEYPNGECELTCWCCEPCSQDGSCYDGLCVANSACSAITEYAAGSCGLGACTCCMTCQTSDDCANAGGQCISGTATCGTGTAPSSQFGCDDGNCKCCEPVCTPSSACVDGPNPGRCVDINEDFCDAGDEYLTDDGCGNADCKCCKTCGPDYSCARKNGICVNPTQLPEPTRNPHDLCPAGYRRYMPGACGTDACICCVPRPQSAG
ncbi:keratin-associated protein 5-3-like [Eriocheir sinensis]|uniref:keratin-associated protein 5-3-like n=1 Tax=Eriocheir sinensis TaxID=95602 RepID=UPI0021C61AD3|nr:keratin-associated protein 5-3-like [Eriocheir sinensis]